jgi:hypothetical protein
VHELKGDVGTALRAFAHPTDPSRRAEGELGGLRLEAAEAALAAAEARERLGEVRRSEVGPHALGEVQLGLSALPQQKIGEALLAAGADDEVDVA